MQNTAPCLVTFQSKGNRRPETGQGAGGGWERPGDLVEQYPPFLNFLTLRITERPATVISYCTTTTILHLQALAGLCGRLLCGGMCGHLLGWGDKASHGGWVGWSVGGSCVSLGRWSPCPTLACYVGLLTPSPDHLERIKWRGVLPHSTPSLHSWTALRDFQELHGRSSWVRRVRVTPASGYRQGC